MAKTFIRPKESGKVKQTLNQLIRRYPKSSQASEAKKLLKTL